MNRRQSIKTLIATSASVITLPAWTKNWHSSDFLNYRSSLLLLQQETLSAATDTIIPPGNSIGAVSVGVDKFLLKLIDTCFEKEVQDNIKMQLTGLDETARKLHQKSFALCDQVQREAMLVQLSESENKAEKEFFELMKKETIRGFTTSREVMMQYLNYKPVPGHYYGCVDVKA